MDSPKHTVLVVDDDAAIRFLCRVNLELDGARGVAVLDDGAEMPYDLFLGVPKHRAPQVVLDSGMTDDVYVPVDPATLRTRFDGVYAIGDVAQIGVPKAGVFAEGAASVVAAQLIAEAQRGEPPRAYDGRGSCYIEFGSGRVHTQLLEQGAFNG